MKVIIIGGVAGGASAAARLRRLDEQAEIILVERGESISYANCGLPYHLGNVIPDRNDLLVMTPEKFNARFRVDVRTRCEAVSIDRVNKKIILRDLVSGSEVSETYDKLILSTGSSPAPVSIPGADHPGVFHLWTLADMDKLEAHIRNGAEKGTRDRRRIRRA
ncbi:MAG: FAD-dependent oxidoreductase [Victivallales bacterium]